MLHPPKTFLVYSTVGIEFVLSVLLGLFAGQWADKKVGAGGALTLLGFLVGILTGFRALWRAAQRLQRETERDEPPPPPPPADAG